ncbi:DNA mismatch repair protein MutS [Candidatus Izimaplasma bacterium HR1]|jgi:DNA mismatch repair protein MutS|uniref:DNA mismatch repair protein MutS n=1 Tax=Candidatus Izimoplasma sp. HR1 TaxID=1541959 RepID=UPI0004F7A7C3|nr:DNA mismatch repair protein MutS [Candidatus Izimaplasma bacterium HR1]
MEVIDKSQYTPMMRQYLTIKEDYNDAIVFFRLGDFYEMFFTDAFLASRELEIQLTARDAGTKEKVPMCGVPHHAAEAYIERLINKGYKVAICEQVQDPKDAKGIVKRDVVRLITPGTYIESKSEEINYIAAIGINANNYTISYLDLSTGDTYSIILPKDLNILINELLQISPKEIIISNFFDETHLEKYIKAEGVVVSINNEYDSPDVFNNLFKELPSKEEKKTFRRLLNYIIRTQKRELMHLKQVVILEASSYLRMDSNTVRNLELTETLRQNNRIGSLFWLIDKCETAMGSRYLKKQILRPLVNKDVLETRYDTIDILNKEFIIKQEIKDLLKNVYDLERIVGRISYGNTNAKDLVQLRRSLSIVPELKEKLLSLNNSHTDYLANSLDALKVFYNLLDVSIDNEPPLTIKEGKIIKEGYNSELDEIKNAALNIKEWLKELAEQERERTGIKKLKIGYNRVFGYYIEIPKGQVSNVLDEYGYTRKQTLSNSERYITPELKQKETIILTSEEKSVALEYELFIEVRDIARTHISVIQKNANLLSEIDMLISLSIISEDLNLSRPILVDDNTIKIIDSRHPVVEKVLTDEVFVPNDIILDTHTDILLITGPNMSGKSTYMRQMALTTILAQIGSFVPARSAEIPVFDSIFTRIGAADDLVSGKSTFMVEMLDANNAIKNATENSLILFDEMGRGTATYDGMALAQAIIEYIHEKIKCKTFFSTHYHELTDLDKSLSKLRNVHVSAKDQNGKIIFLHKVKEGPTDKSYGINVASLADLPKGLIERSKLILADLEKSHQQLSDDTSINLFNFDDYEVEEEKPEVTNELVEILKDVDIDELTPLEALNLLSKIINKI